MIDDMEQKDFKRIFEQLPKSQGRSIELDDEDVEKLRIALRNSVMELMKEYLPTLGFKIIIEELLKIVYAKITFIEMGNLLKSKDPNQREKGVQAMMKAIEGKI